MPAPARTQVDRQGLLKALKTYLDARNLKADWSAVSKSSNEVLVNSLAIVSPYGPEEKQALLEAADLKARAEMLVALAEMELAAPAPAAQAPRCSERARAEPMADDSAGQAKPPSRIDPRLLRVARVPAHQDLARSTMRRARS